MLWEILAAEAGAALIGALKSRSQGKEARDMQIQMRETQSQMRAIQEEDKAQNKEASVMSKQATQEATSGFSAASPTYKGISAGSFDAFLNDENAISLNEEFQQNMLEEQRKTSSRASNASMFGMLENFGFRVANSYLTVGADSKGAKASK